MAESKAPILSLSTLAPERVAIDIDGHNYYMRTEDEFGLRDIALLDKFRQQYGSLVERANFSPGSMNLDQVAQLESALPQLTRLYLMAPEELIAKLTTQQQMAIFVSFSQALGRDGLPPATQEQLAATNRQTRRTGARSSRASAASTAASRPRGST